jgi:hypothetical protein
MGLEQYRGAFSYMSGSVRISCFGQSHIRETM